ncbi:MAG: response regulator transcription factor [Verrucomicrobia bacterium]|nr:response regulator transcription factor [Verrucomicrobiota bacterium]
MALQEDILALLARESGLKGREIAQRLGAEKTVVNSTLHALKARKLTWQDNGYRWFLQGARPQDKQPRPQQANQPLDTPLARLCRYYLQCLSLDDESDVSLFAQSRYAPDYVEIPMLSEFDPEARAITSFPGVADLFRRLRNAATRLVPYVGYPVRLRHHVGQKGWEGFFVEPVFLLEPGSLMCWS